MEQDTHWESSSSWYDKIVGVKGHYYHEKVILPKVSEWIKKTPTQTGTPSLLDLACGQGVLARHLPKQIHYLGIDGSSSLIALAKRHTPQRPPSCFQVHDLSSTLSLAFKEFSHAALILALQNFADPFPVFNTAFSHLKPGGSFLIVFNHPSFRIPRQSSWGIDSIKKWQYRRIDRYMSSLTIPIQTHPGKREISENTLSFHHPLSYFTERLTRAGFLIAELEEWCSDKKSTGKMASMENQSRREFPLFMSLICKKL